MSTDQRETSTGWVCVDCLFFLANGDAPEGHEDEYLATVPDDVEVTLGVGFDECGHNMDDWAAGDESHLEECETREFSWSQCDYCRSTLGGSRHAVTFWANNGER
jgi:hypothetical protein